MNRSFWYSAFAGMCVLFVGIGLCRFAYTAIMPSLIHQAWVTLPGAGYLGMWNLLGYLLAVCLAKYAARYYPFSQWIKISLALSIASLALCAVPWGFAWLALWRFVAGFSGALLMIMTPAAILSQVPPSHKGRAAGIVFTGIGLGIIVSGLLFPMIATVSVASAWLVAAVLALLMTLIAWPAFKQTTKDSPVSVLVDNPPLHDLLQQKSHAKTLVCLSLAYLLYGIGMVPHSLFLVAYVHSTFHLTATMSGLFWSVLGVGALIGPIATGGLADRYGNRYCLLAAYALASLAVALMLAFQSIGMGLITTFIIGLLLPSIPSLISSRILELVGMKKYPQFWSLVTLYCAVSQAIAAYAMSFLLHRINSYSVCFSIAASVFLLGFIVLAMDKMYGNSLKI